MEMRTCGNCIEFVPDEARPGAWGWCLLRTERQRPRRPRPASPADRVSAAALACDHWRTWRHRTPGRGDRGRDDL